MRGLSPYTRGNLVKGPPAAMSQRSIPVHTGKPTAIAFRIDPFKVYPRTHGETPPTSPGLSKE